VVKSAEKLADSLVDNGRGLGAPNTGESSLEGKKTGEKEYSGMSMSMENVSSGLYELEKRNGKQAKRVRQGLYLLVKTLAKHRFSRKGGFEGDIDPACTPVSPERPKARSVGEDEKAQEGIKKRSQILDGRLRGSCAAHISHRQVVGGGRSETLTQPPRFKKIWGDPFLDKRRRITAAKEKARRVTANKVGGEEKG